MRSGQTNIFQCLYAAAVVALLQMPMVLSGCGGSSHGGPSKDAAAGVGGSDAAGADRAVPDAAADSAVGGSADSGGGDVASDVDGTRDAVNGDTARADSGGGDAVIISPDAATPDAATPDAATPARTLQILAGSVGGPGFADGVGVEARFSLLQRVATDGQGTLFVEDGSTIRKLELATGRVTTIAGSPTESGNLYVSDRAAHVIQRISLATAAITTLAGALGAPGSSDGIGTAAHFRVPTGLAFDGHGHLLVADSGNSTVRQIDLTSGQVTTLVGIAGQAKVQPGPLPGGLNRPEGLAVLPNDDIVISDFNENAVLLVH